MKRRSFLGMLGATAAAPLMPALPANAAVLTPRMKAMGIAHAHRFPMVSVMGMTKRLGISSAEAKALLGHLSKKGIISAGVPGTGITSAASKVFKPVPPKVFAQVAEAKRRLQAEKPKAKDTARHTVSNDWLTHLRVIAAQNGFDLSPRALAGVAA